MATVSTKVEVLNQYWIRRLQERLPWEAYLIVRQLEPGSGKINLELYIPEIGYRLRGWFPGLVRLNLEGGLLGFINQMIDIARRDNPWPGMEWKP